MHCKNELYVEWTASIVARVISSLMIHQRNMESRERNDNGAAAVRSGGEAAAVDRPEQNDRLLDGRRANNGEYLPRSNQGVRSLQNG